MSTPKTVFRLTRKHAIVRSCVSLWENGDLVWEDAITLAITEVCKEGADLADKYNLPHPFSEVSRLPNQTEKTNLQKQQMLIKQLEVCVEKYLEIAEQAIAHSRFSLTLPLLIVEEKND